MSFDTVLPLMNGRASSNQTANSSIEEWDKRLKGVQDDADFHGDKLIADKRTALTGLPSDLQKIFTFKNAPEVLKVAYKLFAGKGLDIQAGAQLIGSLPNDSSLRSKFIESQVETKYEKMLHPPLTYLGDAFQYRAADGKFNSVLHPHLGQAGAPYAKTVPSKTHPLGALPDPGDLFDRLMAREDEGGRVSPSGLSSMLIYHATIIIHDIFRTNDSDKNISDSSSYLDLSPLYGYTMDMQRKVRDDKFKLGLLKPDTFAEDRLLRQPPGVCIMLVMYNRYHNYAATQLKRINENGRFSVPAQFKKPKWLAVAESRECVPDKKRNEEFDKAVKQYETAWQQWYKQGQKKVDSDDEKYETAEEEFSKFLIDGSDKDTIEKIRKFDQAHEAAWNKLDDDLFNTARLITCGIYINISIHDYLRALMGFHQYNSTFTLDPRVAMTEHKNVSRGLGNQVTVEFNLLYRFHCAISEKDENYTETFIKETLNEVSPGYHPDPKSLSFGDYALLAKETAQQAAKDPWLQEFGLKNSPTQTFTRNTITGLFDDQKMIDQLRVSMDDKISNFGPRNVPKVLKTVEIMGILQARKWEIGTLNDFREFFGMKRHETFEQISGNKDIQDALRDLYDHPDKVELYPGVFCESDASKSDDPGPNGVDSALWAAIFSDAITLVRSDRFYTVDWNTNSLTSWGMAEVTPDNNTLKSSVFHRLLQRAFPEWFSYDSVRFFHPFYTAETNAKYADQQGYLPSFKAVEKPRKDKKTSYDYQASDPEKPRKPLYLTGYSDIRAVLSTGADEILHPAFIEKYNLPEKLFEALIRIKSTGTVTDIDHPEDLSFTKTYFAHHMRAIVEREVIFMDRRKSIFQLDVTRDLAIPVVTRGIADFLGFGDQVRDAGNSKAKYSENEIYQHITNCQIFLSYNADETKLLKRRTAFKKSMTFLLQLAEEDLQLTINDLLQGNILEASRWGITQPLRSIAGFFKDSFKSKTEISNESASKAMNALGRSVAARILAAEINTGKAAAILLLAALDMAYISVLAFTAVLDDLLQGAYDLAKSGHSGSCDWFEIQKLALKDDETSDAEIQSKVLQAQKRSVRLPFIRKVIKEVTININGETNTLEKGETIICDIYKAMNTTDSKELEAIDKYGHLNYMSSLSKTTVHFNPKDIAVHGLTAMIKVMAQMKNLRRGHTFQGLVKKVPIDQTYEGYANFMAAGRMQRIAHDAQFAETELKIFEEAETKGEKPAKGMSDAAKKAHKIVLRQRIVDAAKIFSEDVLKPKADTYLTAEWNEMVPFPTTWKLRFEGYGPSDYGNDLILLRPTPLPDNFPPFYQPQGPSHYGGTFGDQVPKHTPADLSEVKSGGCGAFAPCLHSASNELGKVQH